VDNMSPLPSPIPALRGVVEQVTSVSISQGATNGDSSAPTFGADSNGQLTSETDNVEGIDTPRVHRTDQKVKSAQKTPTFADSAEGSPARRRRTSRRRRRADTPHPVSETTLESETTTPQTTPEKTSKTPRKRRSRKVNGEGIATVSTTSDVTVGVESPLARKSTRKQRQRKASKKTPVQEEQDTAGATVDHESVEEVVKSTDAEGENITTPADALNVEIEYPLFQTTEILEFEPDFPQPQSPQPQSNGQSIHEGIESDTEPTQFGDGDGESESKVKPRRRFRRYNRPRAVAVAKTPKPKRPVKKDSCPALAILFESYGIDFNPSSRPYLQYPALKQAALEKDPDTDLETLQEEFRKTFLQDSTYAWHAKELKRSTIDEYFARCEEKIPSFRYAPGEEASYEFTRLCVEAGWIKEWPADWDTYNWKESLKSYQKLWEGKEAQKARRRFRNACFWELHQVFSLGYRAG